MIWLNLTSPVDSISLFGHDFFFKCHKTLHFIIGGKIFLFAFCKESKIDNDVGFEREDYFFYRRIWRKVEKWSSFSQTATLAIFILFTFGV